MTLYTPSGETTIHSLWANNNVCSSQQFGKGEKSYFKVSTTGRRRSKGNSSLLLKLDHLKLHCYSVRTVLALGPAVRVCCARGRSLGIRSMADRFVPQTQHGTQHARFASPMLRLPAGSGSETAPINCMQHLKP